MGALYRRTHLRIETTCQSFSFFFQHARLSWYAGVPFFANDASAAIVYVALFKHPRIFFSIGLVTHIMAPPPPILEYCKRHEAHRQVVRDTAEDRAEVTDACKTVNDMLARAMVHRGLGCVRLPDGTHMQLQTTRRRTTTFRCAEDVVKMLTNVSSQVTNVSCEDLPEAVAKIFKRRVGEAGEALPPRVKTTQRVGLRGSITEVSDAGADVASLSRQLHEAQRERVALRERVRPTRDALKSAEASLADVMPPPTGPPPPSPTGPPPPPATGPPPPPATGETVVRVERQGGKAKLLCVTTCEKKVRKACGVNFVCAQVREAARATVASGGREAFDARLAATIRSTFRVPSATTRNAVRLRRRPAP